MSSQTNRRRWTREESLIVFNLYCRIPFKDSSKSHPDVQYIARLVNRTPDSVNMKIGNFGSFDPELKTRGITGLRNASRLDQAVWDEFHDDWEALIEESEQLIADRERILGIRSPNQTKLQGEGTDRLAVTKIRENQNFFRRTILSAYENRCCVTGIDVVELLVASHIKPWTESDPTERLNPRNGLCLNALHDRAFDRGLITVTDDCIVVISDQLSHSASGAVRDMVLRYRGQQISLPYRFRPDPDFLAWHRNNVFVG